MTGIVKKIVRDKGYGFIAANDKKDYFFHYTALVGIVFEELQEQTAVEFEPGVAKDGKVRAKNIKLAV